MRVNEDRKSLICSTTKEPDYLFFMAAKKNNIRITRPIEETTKSVNGLSTDKVCSKYSNNKKMPKSENAAVAYNNLFKPVFLYA